MKLGFTGTQRGMTELQKTLVKELIKAWAPTELHHGDCIGADATASTFAELAGIRIIKHPPLNTSKQANMPYDESRPAQDYLVRNKNIVNETLQLLATPGEETEQLRSGTWSTIRYARKLGRKITIVFPSGRIVE